MSLERTLKQRSNSQCELCSNPEELSVYEVPSSPKRGEEASILICSTCNKQIGEQESMDPNHWRCLNDSMWSTVPAVQVMAWRLLHKLKGEGWPQDLLDMMYLDEDMQDWAEADGDGKDISDQLVHRDSNGVVLQAGDSVVLIKDLKVKGSSMVAKQGTAVRRISLDHENAEYIEGKVDGQQIVIITKYVKKI
ncbi:MAG: PhnA domain-containing protein [Bacteroidia bacterium]|nr:PhnA domain-containing protein [Bacteroidia bacterium]NNF31666.1 PhnA protein [Flavobacteriaceae bacterium]NNJ82215.1 PhnA protein [Flavobacteriaceae bacterium]NNK55180.1 PhnA protein [Flavobacteriaceae bacterium]NNM10175.1 PhnA protein [Flavobacteriaceae bacterium]